MASVTVNNRDISHRLIDGRLHSCIYCQTPLPLPLSFVDSSKQTSSTGSGVGTAQLDLFPKVWHAGAAESSISCNHMFVNQSPYRLGPVCGAATKR
jgi:hypothetical protein